MTRLAVFIATFVYTGLFPFAPGTVGSLGGLVVYGLIARLGAGVALESLAIAVLYGVGVWAAAAAERHFGGVDPGPVVIDEVVGMLITLFLVPVSVTGAIIGLLLFRVFDIVKPFPAGKLEELHGGFGVMSDDAMAGIYANLVLRVLWWLAPGWIVS
jgi:phosphatidylglycerophosphatase A